MVFEYNILLTVPPLSHIGYFMDWLLKRTAGNIRLDRKSFFKFISWFFFLAFFDLAVAISNNNVTARIRFCSQPSSRSVDRRASAGRGGSGFTMQLNPSWPRPLLGRARIFFASVYKYTYIYIYTHTHLQNI